MNYAMVLRGRVIDVLKNQSEKPCWPPDLEGNQVTAVPCDDTVAVGMEYDDETGVFFEPILPEPELESIPPLSEQEQLAIDTALNVEYIACLMEANLQQL